MVTRCSTARETTSLPPLRSRSLGSVRSPLGSVRKRLRCETVTPVRSTVDLGISLRAWPTKPTHAWLLDRPTYNPEPLHLLAIKTHTRAVTRSTQTDGSTRVLRTHGPERLSPDRRLTTLDSSEPKADLEPCSERSSEHRAAYRSSDRSTSSTASEALPGIFSTTSDAVLRPHAA